MKITKKIVKNLINELETVFRNNANKGNINTPEIQDMPYLRDIINKNTIVRPVKANVVNSRQFITDDRNVICIGCIASFRNLNNLKTLLNDADPEKKRVLEHILQQHEDAFIDDLYEIDTVRSRCLADLITLKKQLNDNPKRKRALEDIILQYESEIIDPYDDPYDFEYSPRFEFICPIHYEVRYDSDNVLVTIRCDLTLMDMYSSEDNYFNTPPEITINLFEETYAYIPSLYREPCEKEPEAC